MRFKGTAGIKICVVPVYPAAAGFMFRFIEFRIGGRWWRFSRPIDKSFSPSAVSFKFLSRIFQRVAESVITACLPNHGELSRSYTLETQNTGQRKEKNMKKKYKSGRGSCPGVDFEWRRQSPRGHFQGGGIRGGIRVLVAVGLSRRCSGVVKSCKISFSVYSPERGAKFFSGRKNNSRPV